jgi:hypothetical protein
VLELVRNATGAYVSGQPSHVVRMVGEPFTPVAGTLSAAGTVYTRHAAAVTYDGPPMDDDEPLAARVYLEQFRKSKKALLFIEAEQKGIKTMAEREAYAYAHPDYLELLEGLRVAVSEEERLKTQIGAAQLRIDLYRTEQANQRMERKGYGA